MSVDSDSLMLSRADLYELVWSKPLAELAKDLGISDVGLAKRCRKLGVPVPGRGYWARVAAGQAPRQAPLPKREEERSDHWALRFDAPVEASKGADGPAAAEEYNQVRDRIAVLEVPAIDDLRSASAVIRRTAAHLKRPWCREVSWSRGERTGTTMQIEVADSSADRALRIGEQILVAASRLGWAFESISGSTQSQSSSRHHFRPTQLPAMRTLGSFQIEGERLAIRIDERRRRVAHVFTEEEKEQRRRGEYVYARSELVPTGELRVNVSWAEYAYSPRTWKDGARTPLESQLKSVLTGLLDEALKVKEYNEQQRRAELERRRDEQLAFQQTERREANARLIHELETQAGAWFRARTLRAYLRAVRRAMGETVLQAKLQGIPIDFLSWAEQYVDQLDPLSKAAHHPDLIPDYPGYRPAEHVLQEALFRMLGLKWHKASKLCGEAPACVADEEDE
jgi:hypothetical protein